MPSSKFGYVFFPSTSHSPQPFESRDKSQRQSLQDDLAIPSPGTALNTAKDTKISNSELFIKCFHDYPAMEE